MAEEQVATSVETDAGKTQETPEVRFERRLGELEHNQFILDSELRGVKSVAQRAETVTQQTNVAIASLQESLEERYAPKRALALLERTVRTSLGDDAWETFRRDGEMDQLRQEVKRKPEQPAPPPPEDEREAANRAFQSRWASDDQPELELYAEERGVDLKVAVGRLKSRNLEDYAKPGDTLGQKKARYKAAIRKEVDALEDEKTATQERTRTDLNTTRGGASTPPDADANYLRILKEGGPLPPASEIDKLTAKYAAM